MTHQAGYYKQPPLPRAVRVGWQVDHKPSALESMKQRAQTHKALVDIRRAIQSNVRTNELLTQALHQFSRRDNQPSSFDRVPDLPPPKEATFDEGALSQSTAQIPLSFPSDSLVLEVPEPKSSTKDAVKPEQPLRDDERRALLRRDLRLSALLKVKAGDRSYLTRDVITWCEHPDAPSASPSDFELLFREWLPLRKVAPTREHHIRDMDHCGMSIAQFYERIRQGWQLHVYTRTLYPPDYVAPHQPMSFTPRRRAAALQE